MTGETSSHRPTETKDEESVRIAQHDRTVSVEWFSQGGMTGLISSRPG